MSRLIIEGGNRVEGIFTLQGAKNAALPILAATILSGDVCEIQNCPNISDVDTAIRILEYMGCTAQYKGSTLEIDTSTISRCDIPEFLMRQMRSSVVFLGAILGRMRQAKISFPGGCELGPRPIDLHISSLKRLGAVIREEHGYLDVKAETLTGSEITLSFPSVGATENIILAAVISDGVTTITNAAQEPEIEDLQNFLNQMGAKIMGAGGRYIVIEGVSRLHGASYRVMPDRIVAATYMSMAAVTGGTLELHKAQPRHLTAIITAFEESGCKIECNSDTIYLTPPPHILPVKLIRTMPYPAFPTDALAPVMAYLTMAKGDSFFVETIFQSRYRHVGELQRMGAKIKVEGNIALVSGGANLYGAQVEATDLRGGAALIVAALAAKGVTEIAEATYIERGYENITESLIGLGAKISRKE